jgi:endonuclease/exonuclease/phosphatase family metal-dependent hydrolase
MTWNAAQDWGDRLALLAGAIRAQRPDIVALASPKNPSEVESIAHELGMSGWYGEGNNRWGMALLSRLPVASFHNHRLDLFSTLLEAQVLCDGQRVRVFATHLRGYGPQTGPEHELRTEEARSVLDVVRPYFNDDVLLLGDLNSASPDDAVGPAPPDGQLPRYYAGLGEPPAWQWTAPFLPTARRPIGLILSAGYTDCYRTQHPSENGFTLFSDYPWARIDYVFASPRLADRLVACDVARGEWELEASHHFPVWAEFR